MEPSALSGVAGFLLLGVLLYVLLRFSEWCERAPRQKGRRR